MAQRSCRRLLGFSPPLRLTFSASSSCHRYAPSLSASLRRSVPHSFTTSLLSSSSPTDIDMSWPPPRSQFQG
eukprot:scaffold7654_cov258-Pinguiococcus_pyrenoidosus.AAC.6